MYTVVFNTQVNGELLHVPHYKNYLVLQLIFKQSPCTVLHETDSRKHKSIIFMEMNITFREEHSLLVFTQKKHTEQSNIMKSEIL